MPTQIQVPFGKESFSITVPVAVDVMSIKPPLPLSDVRSATIAALSAPIGTPPLSEIIRHKGDPRQLTVTIAVSDITRPIPYRGSNGIILPLLAELREAGIARERVTIIVATGMHRASTAEEKRAILGSDVARRYRVVDHECDAPDALLPVGTTADGTAVAVNRYYAEAGVKICTGLVESHFMAGFSGGRKSICPGLVDSRTLQRFHGPHFLEDPRTDNLQLAANPCHEEALAVARQAGCDFLLNVAVDQHYRVTGVYAGDMEEAHARACADVAAAVRIPLSHRYDIVITHGGYVGINHYQTAKTGCSALPALKPRGCLLIVACHTEADPLGSPEYRTLLHLLRLQGPDGYTALLKSPSWSFTRDQWEPQMWARVLRHVRQEGLIYVSPQLRAEDCALIPGFCGQSFLPEVGGDHQPVQAAQAMLQAALARLVAQHRGQYGTDPCIAFLADGPYGIPISPAEAA